jgi:Flp pilus assembly protein TadG
LKSLSPAKQHSGLSNLLRAGWARARGDESGATAVDFAFIAPIFIGFLLALPQIAVVWFAKSELENGTEAAARLVLTGQAQSQTRGQFASAICADLPVIFNCSGLMFNLQPQTSLTSANTASPPRCWVLRAVISARWPRWSLHWSCR